jgi:Uma2 family endonuclease
MGFRGSYKQWEEGGITPQVVFEVLSPNNTALEMLDKFNAYSRYGVEEYYVYDPEKKEFRAWLRQAEGLEPVANVEGFQSPRLKVRFWLTADGLNVEKPDGTVFQTHQELLQRSIQEHRRAERLAEKLRGLGIDPEEP